MKIVAKMKVMTVLRDEQNETVHATAVYGGSEANKQWSKYTPNGELKLTISNPDAQGQLKPGDFVKISIEPSTLEE